MNPLQSYQRFYRENQFLFSPFSPIDNSDLDRYHTDLILQNNKDKFEQLLKEDDNVFLSNWLLNQSLQRSITSYLTYRHRPVDSAENSIDLFEYDRMIFLCFAHLAQMTVNHEQEIFSAISLIRLPSLISLGSIMGDSNLANFRVVFTQFLIKRPSLLQEFISTIQETHKTLEQLHSSLEALISAKQGGPKLKYLIGAPAQQKQAAKTGSGIRAVNMKAKKAKEAPTSAETETSQLAALPSFSDSLDFTLDIIYFLSIFSAVSQPYLVRSENVSELGHTFLVCLTLLYEMIIPLLERGIIISEATAEDQLAKWRTMVSLCRNRAVQSLLMIVTSSSLSLRLPIPQNETQSFPWLLLIDPQPRSESLAFPHSWSETIFQMMSGEIVSSSFEGAIFGDLMKTYPQTATKFLQKIFENEDQEKKSYLMKMIQGTSSAMQTPPSSTSHSDQSYLSLSSPKEETSARPSVPTAQSLIQDVKAIFPDYGEFFISSVLEAYGQNPERAIDALLSDNLPPNLQRMDRTTKSAWMGKSSTDSATAVSRKGNEIKYSLELNPKDKERQKLRLRQMEQKQEEDSRILSLEMEYGDDYDDQYDDASGLKATSWQEEREKILRLNKLVRGEEAEDAYWSGMANTNHQRGKGGGGGGEQDEDEDEEGDHGRGEGGEAEAKTSAKLDTKANQTAPRGKNGNQNGASASAVKSKQNHKPSSASHAEMTRDNSKKQSAGHGGAGTSGGAGAVAKANGGSSAGNATSALGAQGGVQRKPKTKTFDKHHQKDKNTRKFGGFAP